MFDDVDKKQTSKSNSSSSGEFVHNSKSSQAGKEYENSSSSQVNQSNKELALKNTPVEDMFAETDENASVSSEKTMPKPDVFKEVKRSEETNLTANNDNKAQKIFVLLGIVLFLLAIGVTAVWLFRYVNLKDVNVLKFLNKKDISTTEQKNNQNLPKKQEENKDKSNQINDNKEIKTKNKEENFKDLEENNKAKIENTTNQSADIDSDQDGLSDIEEEALGTDPNLVDTDNDHLSDREEVEVYETDPLNKDTDGDSYLDGDEVKNGYNPKGSGKLYQIN